MPLPELSAWRVDQLRVTAFVQQNDRIKEEAWWSALFGAPPETRIVRSSEGLFQDEGPFKNGRLALLVMPGRVDWLWKSDFAADLVLDKGTLPSLGSMIESSAILSNLMNTWFGHTPPLTRLAFAPVLDLRVSSRLDAYRLLQEYLPSVRIYPETSSDFVYQINRPIESRALPGFSINRLSKWSALRAIMEVGAQGKPPAVQHAYHAVRLELDVNTFAEAVEPIPMGKTQEMLSELISRAQEIAEKGDQPQ